MIYTVDFIKKIKKNVKKYKKSKKVLDFFKKYIIIYNVDGRNTK